MKDWSNCFIASIDEDIVELTMKHSHGVEGGFPMSDNMSIVYFLELGEKSSELQRSFSFKSCKKDTIRSEDTAKKFMVAMFVLDFPVSISSSRF